MNKKEGDFYFNLLEKKKMPLSRVGKIEESSPFQQLLEAEIIVKKEKRGRGNLVLEREAAFQAFLQRNFPSGDTRGENAATNRIESAKKYRNSKVASEEIPIAWLRGQQPISVNGHKIDYLPFLCERFSLFSAVIKSLHCQHLCFVENKEAFLKAEQVIPAQYTFLHPYGRVGEALMKTIKAETIMVFSDYDYIGLNEYLLIKEHLPQATLFIPDNFEALHATYTRDLKKKSSGEVQKKSARVKQSQDPAVRRVCKTIETTNKFLEQEALFP